ncbi:MULTISPECIES: hypothetical protein [unclassified Pseudofrankia]|uniref:hypothetical protein n=1 Tax=unclassified Pseudofrankia TaxID=2994372 RepID=UPI0018E31489|nr:MULTISPECIES: hypothetical protein [unclassified Pseudofrankia]MDT3440284.1 hypothetical protein [Pseudofrankia sp. BMG5.37]
MISTATVAAVEAEVARAHRKHGERSILNPAMPDAVRLPVLVEEVGEVARAMLEGADPRHLRDELIQVAAVALTWVEALRDRTDQAPLFDPGQAVTESDAVG